MIKRISVNIEYSKLDTYNDDYLDDLRRGIDVSQLNKAMNLCKITPYINLAFDSTGIKGDYCIWEGHAPTILFGGCQLEPDTGFVLLNAERIEDDVVVFNLYEYLKSKSSDFCIEEFKSDIESIKMSEKGIIEVLKDTFSKVSNTGNSSVIKKILFSSDDKATKKELNNFLNIYNDIIFLLRTVADFRHDLVFRKHLTEVLVVRNDTPMKYFMVSGGANSKLAVRYMGNIRTGLNLYSNNENEIKDRESLFFELSTPLQPSSGKSEKMFLNLVDMVYSKKGSETDIMDVVSSPENVKEYARNSKFNHVLKGAALSGVVKKLPDLNIKVGQLNTIGSRPQSTNINSSRVGAEVASVKKQLTVFRKALQLIAKVV